MMRKQTKVQPPVLQPPFLGLREWTNKAAWQRLGHGLIALCDATDKHMIAPGMIMGVTEDNGCPVINRYWHKQYVTPARRSTPLSYSYIFNASYHGGLIVTETDVALCTVLTEAVALFPDLETYTAADWWAEMGCTYDPRTNTARFAA